MSKANKDKLSKDAKAEQEEFEKKMINAPPLSTTVFGHQKNLKRPGQDKQRFTGSRLVEISEHFPIIKLPDSCETRVFRTNVEVDTPVSSAHPHLPTSVLDPFNKNNGLGHFPDLYRHAPVS